MTGTHYTILAAIVAAAIAAFVLVQGGWPALIAYIAVLALICGFAAV